MYNTWEELEEGIKNCQKCKLNTTRTNIVLGVRKQKCRLNANRRRTRSRRGQRRNTLCWEGSESLWTRHS